MTLSASTLFRAISRMQDRVKQGAKAVLLAWIAGGGLVASAPGLPAAKDVDPTRMLVRMSQALEGFDYEGTFVYLQGKQLKAMRVVKKWQGGEEKERLISLNGNMRELSREGGRVSCVFPGSEEVVEWRQSPVHVPALTETELAKLQKVYDFHRLGTDRMAGRAVDVLRVSPRDGFRYGYRLFLDRETGFPLKSDLLDGDGSAMDQIMFTDIRILGQRSSGDVSADDAEAGAGSAAVNLPGRWGVDELPEGFAIARRVPRTAGDPNTPIEHIVLSDGLASLSVFIEDVAEGAGLVGGSRIGAVHAWGTRSSGHQITAVGEVPLATVRKVAEGAYPIIGRSSSARR